MLHITHIYLFIYLHFHDQGAPEHIFTHYQQPRFIPWLFLNMFLRGMVIVLISYDFASWRHDVSKWQYFVCKKGKLAFTHLHDRGVMENWMKHELYHFNNELLWWHDVIHDNMSSRDIFDMTSRHDFMSISIKSDFFYICRCKWTGATILLLFRMLFRSRDTF